MEHGDVLEDDQVAQIFLDYIMTKDRRLNIDLWKTINVYCYSLYVNINCLILFLLEREKT